MAFRIQGKIGESINLQTAMVLLYADLDNDGDLDLVVNNINQPAFIYRNESQKLDSNHFLQVQLIGDGGNTQGLGARLKIFHNEQSSEHWNKILQEVIFPMYHLPCILVWVTLRK